jgi:hypothetical protein
MDTSTVGRGPLIAGVAGILLLIFMFFSWFELDGVTASVGGVEQTISGDQLESLAQQAGFDDTSRNAWQSFGFIDIVLLITVIVAVALAVSAATGAAVQLPVPLASIVTALGAASVILLLIRVISPPDLLDAFGGATEEEADVDTDVGRKIGLFLGLLAAIGVTVGGWLTVQAGGIAPRPAARGPRERAAAPPPPPPSGREGEPPPPPPPAGP